MPDFKTRTDYFEEVCHLHKMIAHDRPLEEDNTKTRKSFYRINNSDELNAACVQWIHFPCCVYSDVNLIYKTKSAGENSNRSNLQHLYFFSNTSGNNVSDAIENAYDEAQKAMEIFLSYLQNDFEENGSCGDMRRFDLGRCRAERHGPVNQKLYGWHLTIEDESKAPYLDFDADNFFND